MNEEELEIKEFEEEPKPEFEEKDLIERELGIKGLLEALDNEEVRQSFRMALGYEPVYDENGNIIGYEKTKEPDALDQLLATLNLMASKKATAIAYIVDNDPLTALELETYYEQILAYIDMMMPSYIDKTSYNIPIELAKVEFLKGTSLATHGLVVRALLKAGLQPAQETPILGPVEEPQRKLGFWARLLGGGEE